MTTTTKGRRAAPAIISLARIRRWKPCGLEMTTVAAAEPDGVPRSRAAALALHAQGVDVMWGALRLVSPQQRRDFGLCTLRQRQPHIIALLRMAGLDLDADVVAALSFATPESAAAAHLVLNDVVAAGSAAGSAAESAAESAAWDAATREQIGWIADALGIPEGEAE